MIRAYFTGIKDLIIENMAKATTSVHIAVAWFTQRDIFNAVINALGRGIDVSLILMDDIINRNEYGLDFSIFINNGGKICFVNNRKVLMHDKFCLFDCHILLTGSYNWTYSAESRNEENIIYTDDTGVCNAFERHFQNLWSNLSETIEYKHLYTKESKEKDFIRLYDDLYNEYTSMASNNIIKDDVIKDIEQRKDKIAIAQLATLTTSANRKDPRVKMNIGMRCRISGIDNKVLKILSQGHTLPFTNSVTSCTVADNQEKILCDIVFGKSDEADENESLIQIELNNLPSLKAGEAKMKTKITLDTNGYMHVECVCINNGIAKEAIYLNSKLIDYK